MRLPGTRYQEHGWEQVRKLLGQCSLQAFGHLDAALLLGAECEQSLAAYVEGVAPLLQAAGARGQEAGNSYGDSVAELALTLVFELQARPADWRALCAAVATEHARVGAFWSRPGGEAQLRKKFNDLYAVLRDKVDSDNYQVACGRACSPNRIYAYRMLDTAYHELARLFAAWHQHLEEVGAVLGRSILALPIEARQLRSIADCRPEWILRWSESQARFAGTPGPLHTRSKRFAALKDNPARIGAMLREIGDYEQLSANADRDWLQDREDSNAWLDDYWRVLGESESGVTPGPDQILEAQQDQLAAGEPAPPVAPEAAAADAAEATQLLLAPQQLSVAPDYLSAAAAAEDRASWAAQQMADHSLPVRLAVYLKLLGPFDDSYPSEWLGGASGELPTMQQLAVLDGVSLPTLRKRRDAAIAHLNAAPAPGAATEEKRQWA